VDAAEFWSIGDYAVVGDLWRTPGRDLAARLDVSGRDVVDLATGTGVTAIAMAREGARSVVGVDLTPSLLAEARRRSADAGVGVDWVEADLCAVPLPADAADLVVSTFGLIFAADPAAALAEAERLTRPDGRIVFTSWSGSGMFGRIRRALSPYFPDDTGPWHESANAIRDVAGARAAVEEWSFLLDVPSAEAFVAQLEQHSAPFVVAADTLGDDWARARADLLEVVASGGASYAGRFRAEVTYLVTTLRR
jgi:ubiquinone/menaquinone biosynthesis C-methylase UbiE